MRQVCVGVLCVCLLAGCGTVSQVGSHGEKDVVEAKPLLAGNWPDPTIVRDGDDYYMTHSSLEYQPGLLIWHSKDLKEWTPICRATSHHHESIWAPDLIEHEGLFYLYFPGGGNWVTVADDPHGPWSEPIDLGVPGIDPGHIADRQGNRYLHVNDGRAVPLTQDGLKTNGAIEKVYDGWPIPDGWPVECFCLESPKLTFRDGWYYLTSAQGGTAGPSTSHMVVSARSRSPMGPWEDSPHNPIIRTTSRLEPWWSQGHGSLVEGPDGQWYCIYHAYKNGYQSMGRWTLAKPITWTDDGWFKVADAWPKGWDEPVKVNMPMSDEFDGDKLGIQWQFYEELDSDRFRLADGALTLNAYGDTPGNSRPLCMMPMDTAYTVETEVDVSGDATAGLMLFAGANAYVGLSIDPEGQIRRHFQGLRFRDGNGPKLETSRVALRLVNHHQDLRLYYRDGSGSWRLLQTLDIGMLHHNTVGNWHALVAGLFAYGQGHATFSYFRHTSGD